MRDIARQENCMYVEHLAQISADMFPLAGHLMVKELTGIVVLRVTEVLWRAVCLNFQNGAYEKLEQSTFHVFSYTS